MHHSEFLRNRNSAIYIQGTLNYLPVVIAFTQFTRNRAEGAGEALQSGGAIYASGDRPVDGPRLELELFHVAFEANVAAHYGGAVATTGGVSTRVRECDFPANEDSCSERGAVYLNVGAEAGQGCSDAFVAHHGQPTCAEWARDELAHQSTGTGGGAAARSCVPLGSALLGPLCCSPSLAAPLSCPWPPVVFDLPNLLCPAPPPP